jgi:hypothetical protein
MKRKSFEVEKTVSKPEVSCVFVSAELLQVLSCFQSLSESVKPLQKLISK